MMPYRPTSLLGHALWALTVAAAVAGVAVVRGMLHRVAGRPW